MHPTDRKTNFLGQVGIGDLVFEGNCAPDVVVSNRAQNKDIIIFLVHGMSVSMQKHGDYIHDERLIPNIPRGPWATYMSFVTASINNIRTYCLHLIVQWERTRVIRFE